MRSRLQEFPFVLRDVARMRSVLATSAVMLLLGGVASPVVAQALDSTMTGAWEGRANITVSFITQRDLNIRLEIANNGAVTGSVGDAALVDARIGTARGAVSRALRLGPEYAIQGRLRGPLIVGDGCTRRTIYMGIDFRKDHWEGTLQTDGTPDGDASSGIVRATFVLSRSVIRAVASTRDSLPSTSGRDAVPPCNRQGAGR